MRYVKDINSRENIIVKHHLNKYLPKKQKWKFNKKVQMTVLKPTASKITLNVNELNTELIVTE